MHITMERHRIIGERPRTPVTTGLGQGILVALALNAGLAGAVVAAVAVIGGGPVA